VALAGDALEVLASAAQVVVPLELAPVLNVVLYLWELELEQVAPARGQDAMELKAL
jgi:hypothetical protein